MHVVLTSNFPRPGNEAVAAVLRKELGVSRIAWASGDPALSGFADACAQFAAIGFADLVTAPHEHASPSPPNSSTALYLSGGDPLTFAASLAGTPLARWIVEAHDDARVLIGASGGAMQLTRNLSLFRLSRLDLDTAMAERAQHPGLGLVPVEMLPHFDRHDALFREKVRRYSERVDHDIWCLDDGTAIVWSAIGGINPIGRVTRLCKGRFE